MRFWDFIFELIGWLLIVLSPTFLFAAIGIGIWMNNAEYAWTLYLMIGLATIGFCLGVIWANRIYKKYGTFVYLSRKMSGEKEIKGQDER